MRKVILFGLLLSMGVATAFGQKSAVQVFGVPFGSTYEEFLTAFKEKGFTGKRTSMKEEVMLKLEASTALL